MLSPAQILVQGLTVGRPYSVTFYSVGFDAAPSRTNTFASGGYPIVGVPDLGADEAGTLTSNYNAFIWESLPVSATSPQHAAGFD